MRVKLLKGLTKESSSCLESSVSTSLWVEVSILMEISGLCPFDPELLLGERTAFGMERSI